MTGRLLVDADVFVALSATGATDLLGAVGDVAVPLAVYDEVTGEPAASRLEREIEDGRIDTVDVYEQVADRPDALRAARAAADHLGYPSLEDACHEIDVGDGAYRITRGDVALLTAALFRDDVVLVSDDAPLRAVCRTLSLPISGTLGVLVAAVERGVLGPAAAREELQGLDEVGPRLSPGLIREAEGLIDEVADG